MKDLMQQNVHELTYAKFQRGLCGNKISDLVAQAIRDQNVTRKAA